MIIVKPTEEDPGLTVLVRIDRELWQRVSIDGTGAVRSDLINEITARAILTAEEENILEVE